MTSRILLVSSRLLAHAEAQLLGCTNPAELPKRAIRYVAALNRHHATAAYVREIEQSDETATAADALNITVEGMSVDELDAARELFRKHIDQPEFQTLKLLIEGAHERARLTVAATQPSSAG